MLLEQYEVHTPKGKICKLYLNGDPEKYPAIQVKIQPGLKTTYIQDLVSKYWQLQTTCLRLFNQEGVEIFDEDIIYIKDGAKLYVSKGEEFDTNTTYSEYKIIRLLGEGGFGKVLLAQHRTTKQHVAIKIVNTNVIGNAQDIDMVFREAELLKSLDHRNIVKILSCYTLSNMQVVFIMEYLEGGELLDYLYDHGPLSEEEARIFFVQVAEAMQYCHSRKLIHRDLKLENILLANKEQRLVKIVDFGIAGLALHLNVDKINVGSLRYMAPETLNGASQKIGPALDIWAMGVILFTLVTGDFPFKGVTSQETIKLITNAEYRFPQKDVISADLHDLISRIFILDPSKRIKLKDILDHQWVKLFRYQAPFAPSSQNMDRYILTNAPTKTELQRKLRVGQVAHLNLLVPGNGQVSQNSQRKTRYQDDQTKCDGHVMLAEILQIPEVESRQNDMYGPRITPRQSYLSRGPYHIPTYLQNKAKSQQSSAMNSPLLLITNKPKKMTSRHMKTDQESVFKLPNIHEANPQVPVLELQKPVQSGRFQQDQQHYFTRRSSKVVGSLVTLSNLASHKTPRQSPDKKF